MALDEIRVGSHTLQPGRQLSRSGQQVHIGPTALSILSQLAESKDQIVTKDEIMAAVWGDVVVEENALQVHIAALRKALGDDAGLLQTARGIGYRLSSAPGDFPDIEDQPSDADANTEKSSTKVKLLWLLAIAVVGSAILFAWQWSSERTSASKHAPGILAVLPFAVSGDAAARQRYGTMANTIATNLHQLPGLEVLPDTAVATILPGGLPPDEIGRTLGADHIVEGDVLAEEKRLVAKVKLIEAATGQPVWSREIAGDLKHPEELEALVLNRLSGVLVALRRIDQGVVTRPEDLSERALDAYIDGLSLLSASRPTDYPKALRSMQLAASLEPEFAGAHAGVAYILANGNNYWFSIEPAEFRNLQSSAQRRAFALEPDNFMARVASAHALLSMDGEVERGLALAEQLVDERGASSLAQELLGNANRYAARWDKAIEHLDRALADDPFNYVLESRRRNTQVLMGDYLGVRQSALDCRMDCWVAGLDWWEALSMQENRFFYNRDIEVIARMFDDERAHPTGAQTRADSILSHGAYLFSGTPNPHMENFVDNGHTGGISQWSLLLFRYGHIDAGFSVAKRYIEQAPASAILIYLNGGSLTPPARVRADPRYHRIFEVPRFKGIADYRRKQGLINGLPVYPARPYRSR